MNGGCGMNGGMKTDTKHGLHIDQAWTPHRERTKDGRLWAPECLRTTDPTVT